MEDALDLTGHILVLIFFENMENVNNPYRFGVCFLLDTTT